jgi:hypothetical protein
VGFERRRHTLREAVSVDRQRAAGRNLMGVALFHDQRAQPAHLPMQLADGVGERIVGAEGVGADELGQAFRLVRFGPADGAHLVQDDGDASLGDLPGGFGAGETAANDVNGFHQRDVSAGMRDVKGAMSLNAKCPP